MTQGLVCQVPNDVVLDGPQKVGGGHAAHDTGDARPKKEKAKVGLAGGKLPLLLNVLGVKAALQSHLFDQFLVVVGDAKALGHRLADGASAAAKFTLIVITLFFIRLMLLSHLIHDMFL